MNKMPNLKILADRGENVVDETRCRLCNVSPDIQMEYCSQGVCYIAVQQERDEGRFGD